MKQKDAQTGDSGPRATGMHPAAPGARGHPDARPRPSDPDTATKLVVAVVGFVVFVTLAVLMKRGVVSVLTAVFLIGAGMAISRVAWPKRRDAAEGPERDGR